MDRSSLIGRRFGLFVVDEARKNFAEFLDKVFSSGSKETCDMALLNEVKHRLIVQIDAVASGSGQECRAVIIDITERKNMEEALQEREALFQVIFDQAFQLMGLMETDGTLIKINRTAADFIETREAEVLGKPFWETPWWTHSPEQQEKLRGAVKAAAKGEFVRFDATHLTPSGKLVWVDFSLKPVKSEEGEVIFLVPEGRDITILKQAKEKIEILNTNLANRANELEIVNRDLEAFSYTVSNDLLKSLLSIGTNANKIRELVCSREDEQCQDYTTRIYDKTKHLGKLIGLMHDFFRPTRGELHREMLDLGLLAGKTAEKLRMTKPERQVAFRIAKGIMANGDRDLLKVVLENLLGNAWKHTGKCQETVIEFGATESEGKPVYFVRDNGIGFDMAHADKLFMPFQRLPRTEEFAGNGIGLATVERIIRRHNGRVWAEGEPGKGATFYFTLESE
jgi:PAS domain S-box-containing protein